MSVEKPPQLNDFQPNVLAPFRDPTKLGSYGEFLLVNNLSAYLEDPYTARYLDMQKYDIDDGMTGEWDAEYESYMDDATRNLLDTIASNGQTFLSQELAKGLVGSPLARTFDKRPSDGMDALSSRGDIPYWLKGPGVRQFTLEDLSEIGVRALDVVAQKQLARYGSDVDPEVLSMQRERVLQSIGTFRNVKSEQEFYFANQQLIEQGYLTAGELDNDLEFIASKFQGNVVRMQGRMWHLAYEMSKDDQDELIKPYSYEMRAFGDVSQREVSEEFYERFVAQKPIEYKEIIKAGLLYTPVKTSTDSIGFFEESGRLVQLFSTDEKEQPIKIETIDRVDRLFNEVDEEKKERLADTFYLLAGNLQVRNILETSLDVRFDTMPLDDQILLCNLLMRATPEQMHAIVPQGPNVIVKVARALEFGDDHGDAILSIAEHAATDEATKVFEIVNAFREHSAKFAGWFKDFDPQFAEATERAMNERLTDALYSIEKIARTGGLEVDIAPHRHSPDYENDGRFTARFNSLDHGLDVLDNLEKTLDLQTKILTAPDVVISKAVENEVTGFSIYRAVSRTYGQMLIYVREYGAEKYARDFEYGGYDGVEGSVSFIVNPLDPHGHLSVSKDSDGASVRFDRQGYGIGESPFVEERSPIREEGSISLDISSILGNPKSMPTQMAYLIAAGNQLRAEKVGSAESLNHNTNGFDQEVYGTIEGFAELPRYTKRNLDAMIANQRGRKLGSVASRRQSTPEAEQIAA